MPLGSVFMDLYENIYSNKYKRENRWYIIETTILALFDFTIFFSFFLITFNYCIN